MELCYFFVLLLDVEGEVGEKGSLHVHFELAIIIGAVNFFEILYLVDDIVMQTGFTKILPMLTVRQVLFLLAFKLCSTDVAGVNFTEGLQSALDVLAYSGSCVTFL